MDIYWDFFQYTWWTLRLDPNLLNRGDGTVQKLKITSFQYNKFKFLEMEHNVIWEI